MMSRLENLLTVSADLTTVIPNIIEDWELSDDFKSTTIFLREGMKWSDGAPLTADDFLFWYEDYVTNTDLVARPNVAWRPGGEVMTVTKINDYTVRYDFAVPYPAVVEKFAFGPLARNVNTFVVLPKHHLQSLHIRYNENADAEAKEAGFDSWWQRFNDVVTGDEQARQDTEFPNLGPWTFKSTDAQGIRYYERNPYYFKVDTLGRQLPLLDRQISTPGSMEVINLQAISGDLSIATFSLTLDNYTVYKENEQASDYVTYLWGLPRNEMAYGFNQTYTADPVLREVFSDLRFRQAMSVAINRDEINNVVAFGRAVARQATGPTDPDGLYTEDWMADHYAQYDPDLANQLLDEMGLEKGSDGYRTRSDGDTLEIIMQYFRAEGAKREIHELVAGYWDEVGVKVVLQEIDRSLYWERKLANQIQVITEHFANRGPFGMVWRDAEHYKDGWGQAYSDWLDSDGASGIEPPQEIKEIYALIGELLKNPLGSPEAVRIGTEILTRHVQGLYRIGTIDYIPQPVIVKNGMKANIAEKDVWSPEGLWHKNNGPETWFWSN
jgi:peptide/nickel transport system substrate-binding protein